MLENFWDKFLSFSRRTQDQLNRWASRYDCSFHGDDTVPAKEYRAKELLRTAKNADRYVCLNLRNQHTIEFRIFRGTLNKISFKATLQMVHLMVMYCKENSFEQVTKTTWDDFAYHLVGKYSELDQYLETRKLIFNEVATVETNLVTEEDSIDYTVTADSALSLRDVVSGVNITCSLNSLEVFNTINYVYSGETEFDFNNPCRDDENGDYCAPY